MIELLPRILAYKIERVSGQRPLLPINLTLSLTHRCNSRCSTCRIWQNKSEELSLEELTKVFSSLGRAPYWVTLSGGEPFLREDIVEVVEALAHYCRPAVINIPTNGSLPEIIPDKVEHICRSILSGSLVVNLSLDGVGEEHNRIRNLKDGFNLAMRTYHGLKQLRMPNLTLGIGTVISKFNVDKLPEIYSYVTSLNPDSYVTEIAENRAELNTLEIDIAPSLKDYVAAIDFLVSRMKESHTQGTARIIRAFRLQYYQLVKQVLVEKRQIIPCYAGLASAQIQPDGQVWACCIRGELMGNLRESSYNFKQVWHSQAAAMVRQRIKAEGCFCPLANAFYTNLLCHLSSLIRLLPI